MKRRPLAYTKADLQRWKLDMLLKAPPTPKVAGFVMGVNIVALKINPSANGIHLIVQDGAGGPPGIILLNPVVAAALRDGISENGRKAGWLEDDGSVAIPLLDG
jgi:hypothetical protein